MRFLNHTECDEGMWDALQTYLQYNNRKNEYDVGEIRGHRYAPLY